MSKIIGIDLGTTNSAVAIYDGTSGEIITNLQGKRTTPSIVAYADDGEILVGETAQRQAVTNPTNTIYAAKRLIGRTFDDPEVQKMMKTAPFKIVKADNGDAWVEIRGKKMAPAQISANILSDLKKAAESYLGEEISDAIITVPAYFNDAQRQATIDAGRIAGLTVKRIINEPTAAALAFGLKDMQDMNVIVYDLGGGTFDVSVLELSDTGMVEVKAANGDTFLGGEDFDNRIVDYLADTFKATSGVDLRDEPTALQRLKEAAENAKKELSSAQSSSVNLPFIAMKDGAPLNLMIDLTRSKLEALVADLVQRSIAPCEEALKDAGISMSDIDEVLLVGGMTRMPLVQQVVKKTFGREPNKGVNPDEVVASGASVQGAILTGEIDDVLLVDVTPLNFSIETEGDIAHALVKANTSIPTKASMVFSNAEDNQDSVRIKVAQGDREIFSKNNPLGEFNLDGIPPMPRGQAQIEVTFDIDANGVLNVTAKELTTGKEQKIRIEANGGLTETEIEAMRQDALKNKDADAARKAEIELANQAQSLANEVSSVKGEEYYKGASEEARTAFGEAAQKLKDAVSNDNKAAFKETVEAYNTAKSGLGQSFTEAQKAANPEASNDDTPEAPVDTPKQNKPPTP